MYALSDSYFFHIYLMFFISLYDYDGVVVYYSAAVSTTSNGQSSLDSAGTEEHLFDLQHVTERLILISMFYFMELC